MRKNLSEVRIEGASIVLVTEYVDTHQLVFNINYPIPQGGSSIPECTLIFDGLSRYAVESRGNGHRQPIINRVETVEMAAHITAVRIHTDQGLREVNCRHTYVWVGPYNKPN